MKSHDLAGQTGALHAKLFERGAAFSGIEFRKGQLLFVNHGAERSELVCIELLYRDELDRGFCHRLFFEQICGSPDALKSSTLVNLFLVSQMSTARAAQTPYGYLD